MKMASICRSLRQTKAMRKCAWTREKEGSRKGAAECPNLTGIWSMSSLQWQILASKSSSLAAILERGKRERREGSEGVL
jgi:hypothetical protein